MPIPGWVRRPLPEETGVELLGSPVGDTSSPPSTLNFSGAHRKRKTLVAPEINISLDQSEGSLLSDDFLDTPDDLDINVDDIETPDETDSLEFLGNGNELEWEDDTPVATAKNMPGDSADLFGDGATEDGSAANGRLWRTVIIGEQEHRIDLHMIRPYMKVVTHGAINRLGEDGLRARRAWPGRRRWGSLMVAVAPHRRGRWLPWLKATPSRARGHRDVAGGTCEVAQGWGRSRTLLSGHPPTGYYGEGLNAIIVFAACFLPDSGLPDYHYIMENLFL
ncbi:hypothetical protein P7K49_032958 [Saguinus oedipus]|uniref:ATCAY kinesin light chain interacting caytaxin n=1 Tax=Saguinus oedipus TaxID=9490 RepID=A0ABQ9TQZ0_SAGOE|nr:hypothetical protein P7K49_032958 [Saguinus oedipus]